MSDEEKELAQPPEKQQAPSDITRTPVVHKVRWKDEAPSGEDSGDESDEEDLWDSDDDVEVTDDRGDDGTSSVRITFSHTKEKVL